MVSVKVSCRNIFFMQGFISVLGIKPYEEINGKHLAATFAGSALLIILSSIGFILKYFCIFVGNVKYLLNNVIYRVN